MLDSRYFEDQLDLLTRGLAKRNFDLGITSQIQELSLGRKKLIHQVEALKAHRNAVTQEISQLKQKAKLDSDSAPRAQEKILEMKKVGEEIKVLDESLKIMDEDFSKLALQIPNIPHHSVPEGKGSEQNAEIRRWGILPEMSFAPKDHVELGETLGILDFERAQKLSGARFAVCLGAGATLERALGQWMLNLHTKTHGYQEISPPYLVNRATMTGTGQLPKFEEDLFKTGTSERELFLIPTAEAPLTNFYRDEILAKADLPVRLTSHTPCFRSEAGSYGRDTRGLVRLHQFQKVELFKIVEPENSYDELESLVQDAEKVLQGLGLPYRVMNLCGGDLGFSATKTYDLEVWLPGQKAFREISSCSIFEDFQARRAQIRYRPEAQGKPVLVHTINGSGLPLGRTLVALLENNQDQNGNVAIPQVLNDYIHEAAGFTYRNGRYWMDQKKKTS